MCSRCHLCHVVRSRQDTATGPCVVFCLTVAPAAFHPMSPFFPIPTTILMSVTSNLALQVLDKDNEIRYLKYQIDKAAHSATTHDTSINQAEITISQLTARSRTEAEGRTKAQLALAEKSSALTVCNSQREGLQVRHVNDMIDMKFAWAW